MTDYKELLQRAYPEITKIVEDRDISLSGTKATRFDIWTRHPLTNKLYQHTFDLAKSSLKEIKTAEDLAIVLGSFMKDWWKSV